MSSNLLTSCSKLSLPNLEKIASETRLVIRKSNKFSPDAFLQSLLSSVSSGLASYNQIAADLKDRVEAAMAKQSLQERFSPKSTNFLLKVIEELMEQRFEPVSKALLETNIQRIVIEDATIQALRKSNADRFASYGNNYGKTAALKIDFAYDILSGTMVSHTLEKATTQDKAIGKNILSKIRPGDLVLRDMGYFFLNEFTAIEGLGGQWLSRLPLFIGGSLENRRTLEKKLKHHEKKTRDQSLDLTVQLAKQKKRCRLVAIKASPKLTEKRRRERREKAKKANKPPCPKGLIRDGWHLMVTSLSKDQASVEQLTEIYRARWAIEIQFRAWKQSLNLSKALNRKSNEHHLQALVLAAMIAHQLGMKIGAEMLKSIPLEELSFEKLYDLLALHLKKSPTFTDLLDFNPDKRHIKRDKRKRKSPINSGLTALA